MLGRKIFALYIFAALFFIFYIFCQLIPALLILPFYLVASGESQLVRAYQIKLKWNIWRDTGGFTDNLRKVISLSFNYEKTNRT